MSSGAGRRGACVAMLLAALVLLAGCGQVVTGSARPADAPAGGELTWQALGKLSTLDPCDLAVPDDFAAHGNARVLARQAFDECRFAVSIGAENVVVELGGLVYLKALGNSVRELRSMPRGVRVLRSAGSRTEGTCERYLSLVGGVTILVRARLQHYDADITKQRLCGVAKAGVQAVYRTLADGRVRHWTPKPASLASEQACSPLSGAAVADELGVDNVATVNYPGRHECLWGTRGKNGPHVELDYVVGTELPATDRAPVEDIGGRQTAVQLTATSSLALCTLSTRHTVFTEGSHGEFEMAVLRVLLHEPTDDDPCAIGRSLAGQVWSKLPSA